MCMLLEQRVKLNAAVVREKTKSCPNKGRTPKIEEGIIQMAKVVAAVWGQHLFFYDSETLAKSKMQLIILQHLVFMG